MSSYVIILSIHVAATIHQAIIIYRLEGSCVGGLDEHLEVVHGYDGVLPV